MAKTNSDKMKDAVDTAADNVRDAVDKTTDATSGVVDKGSEWVSESVDSANSMVSDAAKTVKKEVSADWDKATEFASNLSDKTSKTIKKYPFWAVFSVGVVVAIVGFVAGVVTSNRN